MIHRLDPASMAPAARLAEIGQILATGYRRARLCRQKELAESAEPERSRDSVDTREDDITEEVA